MNQMSSIALWTVYAPIAQITTMIGAMIENGTRNMAANKGTHAEIVLDQVICAVLDMSDGYLLPWSRAGATR